MASKIEWTAETWNPIIGCSKASAGCANCSAENMANRQAHMRPDPKKNRYLDVIKIEPAEGEKDKAAGWNGKTAFVESQLDKPLHWRKPRKISVCSMGDLFHESVPFEWIDKIFATMALCPDHTFQILTKRPERTSEYLNERRADHSAAHIRVFQIMNTPDRRGGRAGQCSRRLHHFPSEVNIPWPLQNVWLGTSVENQAAADERIPSLLKCPAALRFVSVEPMLGPVDLRRYIQLWDDNGSREFYEKEGWGYDDYSGGFIGLPDQTYDPQAGLGWIICGGESGRKARRLEPQWVRSLRDQAASAGVPFMFKQWGEFSSREMVPHRVGKKASGRELDGVEHLAFPEVTS